MGYYTFIYVCCLLELYVFSMSISYDFDVCTELCVLCCVFVWRCIFRSFYIPCIAHHYSYAPSVRLLKCEKNSHNYGYKNRHGVCSVDSLLLALSMLSYVCYETWLHIHFIGDTTHRTTTTNSNITTAIIWKKKKNCTYESVYVHNTGEREWQRIAAAAGRQAAFTIRTHDTTREEPSNRFYCVYGECVFSKICCRRKHAVLRSKYQFRNKSLLGHIVVFIIQLQKVQRVLFVCSVFEDMETKTNIILNFLTLWTTLCVIRPLLTTQIYFERCQHRTSKLLLAKIHIQNAFLLYTKWFYLVKFFILQKNIKNFAQKLIFLNKFGAKIYFYSWKIFPRFFFIFFDIFWCIK